MELKLISMTYTETLDMGLQVAWDTVLFVYNTVRGQASGFIEHGTSNYCDWTSLVSTFIVIGYDVKGDHGMLGEDKLSIFNLVKGENIVSGFSFDHGTVLHCEV